jgi:hypothetical protein
MEENTVEPTENVSFLKRIPVKKVLIVGGTVLAAAAAGAVAITKIKSRRDGEDIDFGFVTDSVLPTDSTESN